MNTIIDNLKSILNIKILQRKLFCLSIMFWFVGFTSGQSPKKHIDVSKGYKDELTKKICPKVDSVTSKIVAMFITKPSFADPECSICIIDKCNETFIEARILQKNLWEDQYKQNKPADSLTVETYCYSAIVSRKFRDKMLEVFTKVIVLHQNREKPDGIELYDGVCYEFVINKNEFQLSAKINYSLKYDDFKNQVALTNLRIIDALRRNSFNETVYDIYK